MEEKFSFRTWSLALFLLLFGGISPAFSSQPEACEVSVSADAEDSESNFMLESQVNTLFDSILPLQKPLWFQHGNSGTITDYRYHDLSHTGSSLNYIKRSRFLEPGLSVKKVIFPFHVFL